MILVGFVIHYVVAVIIFAFIGGIIEIEINPFIGGVALLLVFYVYRMSVAKIRHTDSLGGNGIDDKQIFRKIIDKNDFPFKLKSKSNSLLLNTFKRGENSISSSELEILNLYFVNLSFEKSFSDIKSTKKKDILAFIERYYITNHTSLSCIGEDMEFIRDRLDYYGNNISQGGNIMGVSYSILEKLKEEKGILIPNNGELNQLDGYIFQQLETIDILSSTINGQVDKNKIFGGDDKK